MEREPWKNARVCLAELKEKLPKLTVISANQGTDEEVTMYYENARLFNRRLDRNPFIIVYCNSASDVQITYNTAIKNNLPIRVRGGGHDHEGESSGTDTVLIDLSCMIGVHLDPNTGIAKIGPGIRFKDLTTRLANMDVMIAHGTCATVCIAGFTLGGGWGPWTRKYGMNCERLMGATLLLGDGNFVDVDVDKDGNVPDLLWALRGGGGMSYGIVTEFRIQTFPLPEELIKFELMWNKYDTADQSKLKEEDSVPTIQILKAWEEVIKSKNTSQVIGTNLKINGRPAVDDFDYTKIIHNCKMYGYWEGNKTELDKFVFEHFGDAPDLHIDDGSDAPKTDYGDNLMSSWDRESSHTIQMDMLMDQGLLQGKPIPPDWDKPAPHKISSRLVNKEGLSEEGYSQLLKSLTSPLIFSKNRSLGLFNYVTLGSIVGDHYYKYPNGNSAFPYKDKQYIIQYQTWWNLKEEFWSLGQENEVYDYTNQALDWMEVSRDFDIPHTSGAFISFKDSSIPTKTYFDKSYERLKQIKHDFCKDPLNHFRSRKTII